MIIKGFWEIQRCLLMADVLLRNKGNNKKHGPICPIASYATDQPVEPPQRMEECFAQFLISGWKPMSALPRGVAFAPNVAQIRRVYPSEPDGNERGFNVPTMGARVSSLVR